MRVLLTGGTGLVGCHGAAALRTAGHDLRLLVRDPARIARALGPLGLDEKGVESFTGDVADGGAVRAALADCDAVVHSAALFSLDRRRAAELQRTNVEGTRNVLGEAAARGLDPIVHVSSLSALFPPRGPLLRADDAVQDASDMYASSKARAEREARRLQSEGAPVVCFYPGMVWAPCDPTLGEGIQTVLSFIKAAVLPQIPGGMPVVDARDLAGMIAAAMKPGLGPRRFMASGSFLTLPELRRIFGAVTGRRFWAPPLPGGLMRGFGRGVDLLNRVGLQSGLTHEAMRTLTLGVPGDDAPTIAALGVQPRSAEETLRDVLAWMLEQGLVTPRQVGRIAEA